ncbi:TLD domain-containing protein [Skeletonema marinoi]|uniref:Oxidation resistance protein 1 n=1 Tax=Skeletonema marinoi TaxID=267567 RepID=A0AAD8Y9C3_9STRA|nr:TLD domain-containing protein [Skeletonema marinoi]
MDEIATPPPKPNGGCPKESLRKSILHRCASLTEIERTFLGALLLEGKEDEIESAERVLNDDMLFSVPIIDAGGNDDLKAQEKEDKSINATTIAEGSSTQELEEMTRRFSDMSAANKPLSTNAPILTRSNVAQADLWRAHQDGVAPTKLVQKSTSVGQSITSFITQKGRRKSRPSLKRTKSNTVPSSEDNGDANSVDVQSDDEVGEEIMNLLHPHGVRMMEDLIIMMRGKCCEMNMPRILDLMLQLMMKINFSDDEERGIFKILGTSLDDTRATPHVLSPPLMDSLLSFVPDHLANNNFWLKYSLCRDGASLDILKRYCRAATYTILAIETTNGDVFGSFTSAPWRTHNRYFGTGESFLWRMRHNRNSPVASLFDQAQLESEIDIFPYNGSNSYVQLCTRDKLALGGGGALKPGFCGQEICLNQEEDVQSALSQGEEAAYLEWNDFGFGLALDQNLRHGSTSPSATFGNSALGSSGGKGGQTFDVVNLEVWTLTSASTEKEAQKQEMSLFFVRESISSSMSKMSTSPQDTSNSSLFSADDLNPETFYRRIGENDETELDRDAWNYAQMMNPGSQYGSKPLYRG